MKLPILLTSLILLFLVACKKEDPELTPLEQLPPLTFEGKNTFGCLIDGEAWVAKVPPLSGLGGSPRTNAVYNSTNGGFGASGLLKNNEGTIFQKVKLEAFISGIGTYSIYPFTESFVDAKADCVVYLLDSLNDNFLQIDTLDLDRRIVAGRFEFTAINYESGCSDTIQVTEGRFDLILN